jgi:hypothetical protein
MEFILNHTELPALGLSICTSLSYFLFPEDSQLLICDTMSLGVYFLVFLRIAAPLSCSTLKLKALWSFRILRAAHPEAQHYIPEDLSLCFHHCEYFISCILFHVSDFFGFEDYEGVLGEDEEEEGKKYEQVVPCIEEEEMWQLKYASSTVVSNLWVAVPWKASVCVHHCHFDPQSAANKIFSINNVLCQQFSITDAAPVPDRKYFSTLKYLTH